ncbi:NAD(P)-binding protein [Colletotrichum zoysiae]|uniref:NAD(P)-binding protein n=1 Tax=Colletotrichum zoysiae TaxID=1216348 RepID=A0AAD9H3M3_9PEZI|nr:NAD(P)-binding protein [Colletotrichum zoysiae]
MSGQQGRKIAIFGASGNIGGLILNALREKKIHTITAFSRATSSATFPSDVVVKKGDYADEGFLVSALQGQDVIVLALGFDAFPTLQVPIIRAAAKAGVKWVLPTEFASDVVRNKIRENNYFGDVRQSVRDAVEEQGMAWIAVVTNPWFDYSLERDMWGFNIKGRTARLFDGGSTKFVTTTIGNAGKGTAGVLSLPDAQLEAYRNKPAYLASFTITQRQIFESLLRATGTQEKDWKVTVEDSDAVLAEAGEKAKQGDIVAIMLALYVKHMREGWGGDYSAKIGDLSKLGIAEENLDEVVKTVVAKYQAQQ